jgi:hypothetical protein
MTKQILSTEGPPPTDYKTVKSFRRRDTDRGFRKIKNTSQKADIPAGWWYNLSMSGRAVKPNRFAAHPGGGQTSPQRRQSCPREGNAGGAAGRMR